jgi:hypothetical protein
MAIFYLSIALMVLAVAVAVLPVLLGSIRHHRSLQNRQLETAESSAREVDFWHHMLGRRKVEEFAPTPAMVEDAEVVRVLSVEPRVSIEPTLWKVPVGASRAD